MDKTSLDQAFSNPLMDLSPNAVSLDPRMRKPATLQIAPSSNGRWVVDDAPSPACSTPPRSPMTLEKTFDGGSRRGTFGCLPGIASPATQPLPDQNPSSVERDFQPSSIETPTSAMEFLQSPIPSSSTRYEHTLRHAASFDLPRTSCYTTDAAGDAWGLRQRYHSADSTVAATALQATPSAKPLRSVASQENIFTAPLSVALDGRKISTSSESSSECFTPLAPRLGARRFDRTRTHALASPASLDHSSLCVPEDVPPMRDPIPLLTPPQSSVTRATRGVGLRTGPQVYEGIEIPCASIHLHSDPEDNLHPALAQSLSAGKLRRLKKKSHSQSSTTVEGQESLSRFESGSEGDAGNTGQAHPKGSSKWWSHILHA